MQARRCRISTVRRLWDGTGEYPTPWCNEPTAAANKGCGYTVTDKAVIVRWNITGGFDYVGG